MKLTNKVSNVSNVSNVSGVLSKTKLVNIESNHFINDLTHPTHLTHNTHLKRTGFTLAEVLITLGIIGVVAAITMPTLIAKYQKYVFVNQLKKSYSVLSLAHQKIMADEGVTVIEDTPFMTIANLYADCAANAESDEQTSECKTEMKKSVFNFLKKYLNTVNIKPLENYSYTLLNNESTPTDMSGEYAMFLSDGTIILNYSSSVKTETKTLYSAYWIDVNGLKGPNIMGRDIFQFYYDYDRFFPKGSKAYSVLLYERQGSATPEYRNWESSTTFYNCRTDIPSDGSGCAGRIFDVGKMDY